MASALAFLDEKNVCGQTLLRLVARGSAIIAELLRLSGHIPPELLEPSKYDAVLFDFRYLKTPEMFDKAVNTSVELGDLDEDFSQTNDEVLTRFARLFESIFLYIADYNRFLAELEDGFFIQHTLEGVLLDADGKQLLCEALHLMGVALLLMDVRVPGPVRAKWTRIFAKLCSDAVFHGQPEILDAVDHVPAGGPVPAPPRWCKEQELPLAAAGRVGARPPGALAEAQGESATAQPAAGGQQSRGPSAPRSAGCKGGDGVACARCAGE